MKKQIILTTLMATFMMPVISSCSHTQKSQLAEITEGIRFCESTYPYEGSLLIANFGSEQLNPLNSEGRGYILQYKDGKTNVLIPADGNLSAPKGMFEKDGFLYICDVNKLVIYNLNELKEEPQIIPFPENDLFLNDLAASGNNLYISVTNSGRIYRLDISQPTALDQSPLEKWLDVTGPNGILIDGNNMYIATYPADGNTTEKNVIYKVNDLNNPTAEIFFNVPGQYDGIALSADKSTLYISNWTPAEVTAINVSDGNSTKLSTVDGLTGPADMTLENGILYIPDLPNSRVLIQKLP